MSKQSHEVNAEYVINSLQARIGEMSSRHAFEVAQLEAIIATQQEELNELRKSKDKPEDK